MCHEECIGLDGKILPDKWYRKDCHNSKQKAKELVEDYIKENNNEDTEEDNEKDKESSAIEKDVDVIDNTNADLNADNNDMVMEGGNNVKAAVLKESNIINRLIKVELIG